MVCEHGGIVCAWVLCGNAVFVGEMEGEYTMWQVQLCLLLRWRQIRTLVSKQSLMTL